jgi:hypothetical protein
MRRDASPEESVEDYMTRTGYWRTLPASPAGWQTYTRHSRGNNLDPVSSVSYARQGDHAAMVAHQRYVERDANAWQMNNRGNPVLDASGNMVHREGYETRAVPVSYLVGEGAHVSHRLNSSFTQTNWDPC